MSVAPSGCSLDESEIYNAGTFTATGSMNYSRYWHTATALPDGTILISGGLPYPDDGTQEIYNVATGKYSPARNLLSPRFAHTATPLPSGVLLVGGYGVSGASSSNAEIYGSTWLSGGLYPKYMVLDIMYAPPGSGSTMTYSGQSSVGSTSSTTNSFQEQMMISVGFGPKKVPMGTSGGGSGGSGGGTTTGSGSGDPSPGTGKLSPSGSVEFDYTYLASGTDAYSLTTATTDTIAIPGAKYTGTCQPYQKNIPPTCPGWLGVDHESDIVWIWLNPEMDYTAATANSVVWNGYAANPADTNVAPGNMDIVPLTIAQLDGTAPIPPELMAILDRNWDPVSYGGAGGLTQSDLLTILQRDPFATNLSRNGQPSTAPTNIPTAPTSAVPIYDPSIPSLDPVSGVCGGRYAFDPILGQTFPYSPLGNDNQANTLLYTLSSQAQSQWSKDTTDTYSVSLSGSFNFTGSIVNSLKASDTLTFKNESNPSTNNSATNTQTLSIKSPLPTDGYSGPTQMQVWRDDLYGTYMFYPKPNDTTVNLQSSWLQSASFATITATIVPDPAVFKITGALPTGSVTFYDGCTQLGTQPVTASSATLNYAWSTDGIHEIRALYSGDTNYFHNVGNTLSLNVTSSTVPYISSISPSTGAIGTQVTLNGANFGVSGTVTFNGIPATNTTWVSSTSVQAVVPLGATSGPVTITTNNDYSAYGTTSNNVLFTVTQPNAAATTTTLVLTPTTSWTGYSVVANTLVTAGGGIVPAGTVNCISSPSTGASNTAGTVNPNTGVAQVAIQDLPVLSSGSSSASYTETCTFTPGNSALFASSQSNPISGTVIPVPAATSSNTGGLNIPRENQQATLLNDGTVLITGGDAGKYAGWREDGPFVNILQSSEIYVNGSYVLGAEMTTARTLHQATLLSNSTGQVLITGGTNWNQISGEPLASAELFTPGQVPGSPGTFAPTTLYDPAAQAFTTTVTAMNTPRFWHTATLLPNGKVLIVGGTSTIGLYSSCPHNEDGNQNDLDNCSYMVTARQNGTSGSSLSTAELYDPLTGKFTYTSGPMITARSRHTATLLLDGTVLITGGIDNNGNAIDTAEIYDPATDTFQATNGIMIGGRIRAAATRLGDGTVLITGGSHGAEYDLSCPGIRGNSDCPRIDAEIYNPVTGLFSNSIPNTFTQIGNMNAARYSHTSTMLSNGTVLIAGGRTTFSGSGFATAPTELYDPSTGQFTEITSMLNYRYDHTATSMATGGVLLVGGAEGTQLGACTLGFIGGGCDNTEETSELYLLPIQSAGVHPKFMVLNVMYAPPGSGSSVTYTNQTQVGVGTTATQTKSNAPTLSLSGSIGIATIGGNGNYTNAQSTTNTYSVNTTTTDAMTVPGSSSSTLGVDHEADVIWVWLNPESDFSLTAPSTLVWNGYATNQNDPNVALGMMDIVALTVGQLDGSTPIPPNLRELLDRNWDTISSGGAGPITNSDLQTILQRDPFAVNLTGNGPAAAPTNTPIAFSANYPVVDPNIPTHDLNNPDPTQCGQRYSFNSATGNTFQYATLGSTNQAFSQTYSLQSNTTTSSKNTASDTYFVDLAVGACFGTACQGNPAAGALSGGGSDSGGGSGWAITVAFGDKYSWGETSGTTNNGQSMVTQALTIKNPLPSDSYGGPVQMQAWTDNIFGMYMFYPKATDTNVSLTSSQATTNTGDLVTFTTTVTPDPSLASSGNGTIVPTGYVTFYDGCNVIGSPQQLTNGVAMVSTSWSTVSSHTIQAVFSGDTTYFHNDAPALTQTVSNSASLPYINVGGITPASGIVGTVVNIYGMNFGSSGVVTFNGVPATASSWSQDAVTTSVPVGATSGPVVVSSSGYSSNGVPFTVTMAQGATTTTLMLSPVVSWSGDPVDAHVTVTGPAGVSIPGAVSCSVSSSTGTTSSPSVPINAATSTADVSLLGLPTVSSGATATATYTASCAFVSGNPYYAGSQSNTATGTVTNSPAATNTPTTGLNVARENHQANLLQNGAVLITGGDDANGDALSSAEILVGNSFSLAAPMSVARTQHQATLLSNSTGQVLVTGGWDDNSNVYSSAELFTPGPVPGDPGSFNLTTLYDPTAQAFTGTVTSMNVARYLHTATQLTSGKVLITGGLDSNSSTLNSAELFDPTTGIFTYTAGTLQTPRFGHNATLLTDGTVLITGGTDAGGNALDIAEIFNPATGLFTVTTNASKTQTFMTAGRSSAQTVLLGGGMVLITGGQDSYGNLLNSAELYSPTTGTFTSTQDTNGTTYMTAARSEHTATILPDGTVLIAGGLGSSRIALSSEEIYNPATGDFSLSASSMITPRSNHTATEMPNGSVLLAGGVDYGSTLQGAEVFSTSISSGALFPKFMVLDVLYAPPGAGSTMTYTGATTVGTSTSTENTFANAKTDTVGVSFGFLNSGKKSTGSVGIDVEWGHTFTQDGTSSFAFNTTTTDTLVVPGAVAANTAATTKISTGVDHEADIIRVWLNPATIYTLPPSSSNTIIWDGFATNPNDPNVAAGAMDIVSLTVSQLDGTSPIPPELKAALDRNWDPTSSGGAGGLQPGDFRTILQRDPFATNTVLNNSPAFVNNPTSYFDPNIPVPDPLASNQCSTRYNFDPVLGQTFAFGQLGSTNQPFTQNYSLLTTTSNVNQNTTIDQYSVDRTDTLSIGPIPILPGVTLSLNFADSNMATWTNTLGSTKTNTSAVTQALSIKSPAPSDNYTGPTQMQIWQNKIYGTFMFYPVSTDTNIVLTSSQSTAGPGDTILLTAAITADPKIASSTNPPLAPTGTVNFYDGCTLLGSAQINSATGVASLTQPSLAVGSHSILASYSGDSHFLHNVSEPFTETVANATAAVPYIGGLSPVSGAAGSTVIVSGMNFGSSGTVTFNGVTANSTPWTATSITATVPASATTGAVIVTSGGVASNGIWYIVNQPTDDTSTSVTLSPATSLSGYPVAANVTVTGAVNTIPSGTVSCTVASSMSAGTPFTANLNATSTAQVMITSDLPVVPANATPVPFTVTCSFTGNSGFANSQSVAVPGTIVPVPGATDAAVGSLNTARENHQATLLQDGTVLITGGDNGYGPLDSAEIYINGNFNVAATMTMPRTGHQQTLLSNSTGQVLITGGSNGSSALASAELFTPGAEPGMPGSFQSTTLYDTEAETYTNTPTTMTTARYKHTATQLTTGKVLIAGGSDQYGNALASAELYDPTNDQTEGTFQATKGAMNFARIGHSATLLLDGTVLIAGGTDQHGNPLNTAEIYNPLTNVFTVTQTSSGAQTYMNVGRVGRQATRLGSGQVLISGGQNGSGNSFNSAEIYDPKTGTFQFTQTPSGVQTSMTTARSGHSTNLLNDGTVLIAGGQDTATDTQSTTEIYNPVTGTFSTAGVALQVPRHNHTATVLPGAGVLIAGGTNTTAYGSTTEANAELYSPFTLQAGLHPKFMVVKIQYAPPGAGPTETSAGGSTMTYANATTVGTSTTTDNSFETQESVSWSWGFNLGFVKYSHTVTETWADTQDSSDTYSLNSVTTNSDVVPGPDSSSLGVDHESDVIWIWLNPVANYTITSPNTFVWNGFAADPNDPNSQNGAMDVIPLSVSQLDGTSTITQAEWDILDRNWDPIALGGAGPITAADFLTILGRDPFATNLSGVGRATAPTTAPTGSQYVLFDPNVATFDSVSGQCGNRYDFSPGFDTTFPFTQLGNSYQQAITQTYQLATTTAQNSSTTTTDTYKVALSSNFKYSYNIGSLTGASNGNTNFLDAIGATTDNAKNSLSASLKVSGSLQWTNTWTNKKNNSTLQTQTLTIKNPLTSDHYTGPEQMQVWMDNLYGTYMFYPKPSDTNWILMSSQNTVTSGNSVTLTVVVTADPHVPYIPSGTVTFYDGCTNLGSGTVDSATGTVSVTAPLSGSGQHTIVAIYSGDTNFFHNNSNSVAVTVQ
jgi:Bacterial Ig-like domain (group 3)/Galactose oxidase, central domain